MDAGAERKNDLKPAPLENGLSPTSGPTGHTPVATTPKASAAHQQAATTGREKNHRNYGFCINKCNNRFNCFALFILLFHFWILEAAKPAAKTEDLVLSVLIGELFFIYKICESMNQ